MSSAVKASTVPPTVPPPLLAAAEPSLIFEATTEKGVPTALESPETSSTADRPPSTLLKVILLTVTAPPLTE